MGYSWGLERDKIMENHLLIFGCVPNRGVWVSIPQVLFLEKESDDQTINQWI